MLYLATEGEKVGIGNDINVTRWDTSLTKVNISMDRRELKKHIKH